MMKYVVVAVVLLCATFAYCGEAEDLWAQWLLKYGKSYVSAEEHNKRFSIFKDNLDRIADLNKQSKTATFATNQFADLTKEEFKSKFMSTKPVQVPDWPVAPLLSTDNLPTSFDWRTKGAVTPVKNQEQCGSCWAFSAVANIEGQWFLAGNKLTSLSEQNLVDCDHECIQYEGQQSCDSGCNGGLQPGAYTYVIKNGGIDTEDSYPYTAANGKCSFKAETVGAKITNFTMVSSDEDQMAAYLVQNGPLAIAADAAEWQFYFGGVFDLPCGKTLDHGIAIVGYSVKSTIFGGKKPYWIIKNSWGAGWGEQGYIYVERGNGKCGLNTFVSSAIIGKN